MGWFFEQLFGLFGGESGCGFAEEVIDGCFLQGAADFEEFLFGDLGELDAFFGFSSEDVSGGECGGDEGDVDVLGVSLAQSPRFEEEVDGVLCVASQEECVCGEEEVVDQGVMGLVFAQYGGGFP